MYMEPDLNLQFCRNRIYQLEKELAKYKNKSYAFNGTQIHTLQFYRTRMNQLEEALKSYNESHHKAIISHPKHIKHINKSLGATGKTIHVSNWGKSYLPLRVWCCIKTVYNLTKMVLIQDTWGRYCDNLLFFIGDDQQTNLEQSVLYVNTTTAIKIIKLQLKLTGEGKEINVWEKTWKLQQYLYDYHLNEFDWIIQADNDAWFSTYNFKLFAQYLDPDLYWYLGDTLFDNWRDMNIVYNAGGVFGLSRGAIVKLAKIYKTKEFHHVSQVYGSHYLCNNHISWVDDVVLGACLKSVGVFPLNTLDEEYKTKWSCFRHEFWPTINMQNVEWYFENRFEGIATGEDSLSQHLIALHGYKETEKAREVFMYLDKIYNKHFVDAETPTEPTTFLFNTSWSDFDEYFNIKIPPIHQKLWKGVDNLWDYSDKHN